MQAVGGGQNFSAQLQSQAEYGIHLPHEVDGCQIQHAASEGGQNLSAQVRRRAGT